MQPAFLQWMATKVLPYTHSIDTVSGRGNQCVASPADVVVERGEGGMQCSFPLGRSEQVLFGHGGARFRRRSIFVLVEEEVLFGGIVRPYVLNGFVYFALVF